MQAAIGRLQTEKLQRWHRQRQDNASLLSSRFRRIEGLRPPEPPAEIEHGYYKYYAFIRPERLKPGWNRDRIMEEIAGAGIPCMAGICPEIYRERAFIQAGLHPAQRLPVAKELGETSLMFHVHPTLGETEMERTCQAVEKAFAKAERAA
jgi:hypothetical protein